MSAPDTLIAVAPDGTLIARPARLHQATVSSFGEGDINPEHEARCTCGWIGETRRRRKTAERDAERHENDQPPQVIFPANEYKGGEGQ